MDWNEIEGKWKNLKGRVREKWGKLTDDDIDTIGGKKDQLVGKLQERYGMAKDDAERDVNGFADSCEKMGSKGPGCGCG